MNVKEYLEAIMSKADADHDVTLEFPGLCGYSDVGKSKGNCKNHGHLALSVDPQTVRDTAFGDTHAIVLLCVPKSILKDIKSEREVSK